MARKKDVPTNDVVTRVRERYAQAANAYREERVRSLEEVAFCDPENQWDPQDKQKRKGKGRPCLTVDRMSPFLDQIANDQRMNRQSIDVHPVDDQGDVETAKIIKGLIRHIEYDSNADYAYDTAFMSVLRGGFGFIRVYLDYCSPDSFDQDIKIGRVPNAFDAMIDPASTEPDGSDMDWAILQQDLSKEEYKRAFPNSDLANASSSAWRSIGDGAPDWINATKETVRIVEYFEKVRTKKTIYQLGDGTVSDSVKAGAVVVSKRDSYKTTVKHYVVNAVEVLAETVFPGEFIPVFPVYGQELVIDGQVQHTGLVRKMMDVQKMVNYWKSAQTEMIALAPKAPWVGPRGFRGDMEKEWAAANRENYSTLEYEPVIVQGQVMPPPNRNVQEPAIQAITHALVGTEEDLKAVTGIYDPALGNRGDAAQSGVAIRNLQHQGQMGNFHFADNLSRSIRHLGRVLVSIIPLVYDTPRTVRIVGIDDEHSMVRINEDAGETTKDGKPVVYDLQTGKYDVVVTSGPSYATRRQENLMVMLDMMKNMIPQQSMLITDLVAGQMDTPVAREISDRLKKMLPPQLQDQKEGEQAQIPPQIAQQMQGLSQQHEQLVQALQAANDELEQLRSGQQVKAAEMQLKAQETQAKISIENQKIELEAAIARGKQEIEEQKLELEHQKLILEAQKFQAMEDDKALELHLKSENEDRKHEINVRSLDMSHTSKRGEK